MTGFFDLLDPRHGTLYLFEGERLEGELEFTVEAGALSFKEALPRMSESCLSLPLSMLDFRFLEFPFGEPEKIRQAVPFELEGIVLKEMGQIVFDIVPAGTSGERHRVLAAYADKHLVKGLIESLKALGAEPRVATSLELGHVFSSGADLGRALLEKTVPEGGERPRIARLEMEKPVINLRRGEIAYTKEEEKLNSAIKKAAILAGVVILILLLKTGMKIYLLDRQSGQIEARLKRSYAGIMPVAASQDLDTAGIIMKARLKELRGKESQLKGVDSLEIMKALTESGVKGVAVKEIAMDQDKVLVTADAPSLGDMENFKSSLLKRFKSAEPVESKTLSDNTVTFTMRVTP